MVQSEHGPVATFTPIPSCMGSMGPCLHTPKEPTVAVLHNQRGSDDAMTGSSIQGTPRVTRHPDRGINIVTGLPKHIKDGT